MCEVLLFKCTLTSSSIYIDSWMSLFLSRNNYKCMFDQLIHIISATRNPVPVFAYEMASSDKPSHEKALCTDFSPCNEDFVWCEGLADHILKYAGLSLFPEHSITSCRNHTNSKGLRCACSQQCTSPKDLRNHVEIIHVRNPDMSTVSGRTISKTLNCSTSGQKATKSSITTKGPVLDAKQRMGSPPHEKSFPKESDPRHNQGYVRLS